MAITVCGNKVNFGSYTLTINDGGLCTEGTFESASRSQPFVGTHEAEAASFAFFMGKSGNYATSGNVDQWPYASEGASSGHAQLSPGPGYNENLGHGGASSDTHGYAHGFNGTTTIDKFSFSAGGTSTDVGTLASAPGGIYYNAGNNSRENGYNVGGYAPPLAYHNRVDKWPFSSDSPATCVLTLSQSRGMSGRTNSCTHGYTDGGEDGFVTPSIRASIDKWPFSSDSPASSIGNTVACPRARHASASSADNGYAIGGTNPGTSNYEKHPFSSDSGATSVGTLTNGGNQAVGATYCDTCGYMNWQGPSTANINKFPFASDTSVTTTGCLSPSKDNLSSTMC